MSILDWFRRKTPEKAQEEVEKQPHVQRARAELRRVSPIIEEIERVQRIAAGADRNHGH